MSHPFRRREFLLQGARFAAGCSLLPLAQIERQDSKAAKPGALIADLEKRIPALMKEATLPGLSVAIVKDAQLLWRRGFGVKDSASNRPVDLDTVFEAASISKTVFAYAVLKLCEKGVIGLDTPLTKYTSERFLEGDARLELITARHVLSHTSGFQNWRSDKEPLKIHFAPGEKYLYSGEGYHYLQTVMARVTGQPIEPYMRANLFVPFDMTLSGYAWNDTFERHAARAHDAQGKPIDKPKPTVETAARYGAAGELRTTPTDYAKFLIEVIDPKASDLFRLSKDTLTEMVRPQVKVDESSSWALGWRIQHSKQGDFITHGGYNKGFHAFAAASIARRSGYVLMTNGDNGGSVINTLIELLAPLLAD